MSERKLKGLLTPTTMQAKIAAISTNALKKSTSPPSPSPTIATSSHRNTPNNRLQVTNIYYEIPGMQNFFYNPIIQSEMAIQPSPWLGSLQLVGLKGRPPLSHASAHTAADSHGDQTGNQMQPDNDCSNSLCSLVKKLNVQFASTPKNLEELLQRSFNSMPSYSVLQSPMGSAFPSPFIRSQKSSFMFQGMQPGSSSDLSFRGSFSQRSPFSSSQILKPKANALTDEGLISQLAELLSRETDGKIKGAITGLISKFNGPENQEEGIFGNENVGNGGLQLFGNKGLLSNLCSIPVLGDNRDITIGNPNTGLPKPKTISLSNGLTMNAVNRSPQTTSCVKSNTNFKVNPQNNKVEAARKELFVLSESSNEKKSQSTPTKQTGTGDFYLFDVPLQPQNSSPLISSTPFTKEGFRLGMVNPQAYTTASNSLSQQATSLSTNSSHSDNQKGSNKKISFELTGKFQVNNAFKVLDNIPLQNKILDSNITNEPLNINFPPPSIAAVTKKSLQMLVTKEKPKVQSKKSRSKVKKVSVEEYVKHVNARSRNESNLTIEETWEDEEDWSEVKPEQIKVGGK